MQLVNATPVPAELTVSDVGGPARFGMVVAKATYHFDADGPFDLVADDPVPLFPGDVPIEAGLLPRDNLPWDAPRFEVIVLGHAHAPGGKPVGSMRVSACVGPVERELAVFGDRVWLGSGPDARIGPTQPFTRMPLTWDRAFGGSADVLIDAGSPVAVAEPYNRLGKGFDHARAAEQLREQLAPPPGYPKYDPARPLPNLEDPKALIARWDDAPRPVCWATVPMDLGLHALRSAEVKAEPGEVPEPRFLATAHCRAHPDWVIPVPQSGAVVVLEGLTPDGPVAFAVQRLRVLADWVIGEQTGTSELVPQTLVILPDRRRYYIVYRFMTRVFARPGVERSIRLRLEEGWYQPPGGK